VPTKNSARVLAACLRSLQTQTHHEFELIVVDNHSTDATFAIARTFTDRVYTHGPERSSQRNFGAARSAGEYLLFIDSDMVLAPEVIRQCVAAAEADATFAAAVIPEESFGTGFWAQCKKLERSFYHGVEWMEAARFFRRDGFFAVGGYDEALIAGEDWDLSQRIARVGRLARITSVIAHDEGAPSLGSILKKKLYYAVAFKRYARKQEHGSALQRQAGVLARYGLFFRDPKRLFAHPGYGFGVLFMKTVEFGVGAIGYVFGVATQKRR
jgi:glycosyltransferase involved in cell wall biosynthesis